MGVVVHQEDSGAASPPGCHHLTGSLIRDLLVIEVVLGTMMGERYLEIHVEGMGSHEVQGRRVRLHEGWAVRGSNQ